MVVIKTTLKNDKLNHIDESRYFINPVIYRDVSISDLNKRIYKKIKGLRIRIRDVFIYYSKRKFHKLRLRIRPYVLVNNDTKRAMFIINMVLGKDKPSMPYLKESLVRLYNIGRDSGYYILTIELNNDTYLGLDKQLVIKEYLNTFKQYPGILHFIVDDEDAKNMVIKESKKHNIKLSV